MIASYMMRHDNFLTAMIQNDVIDIRRHKDIWYSRPLMWVVKFFIIDNVSIHQRTAKNTQFLSDVEGFQMHMRTLAVLSLVTLPFILIHHISMAFFSVVQRFAGQAGDDQQYRWSGYARIKLRKHNEVDHSCRLRLQESAECAETAIRCYPNYFAKELIYMAAFPVTSMIGLIILFTLNDSAMLFNISIFNRPLFVLLSILGPIAYVCCGYLATFQKRVSIQKMTIEDKQKLVDRLISTGLTTGTHLTHSPPLSPQRPQHRFPFSSVRNVSATNKKIFEVSRDLKELYKHTLELFIGELIGVICLPYVLFFVFTANAEGILSFLNRRAEMDKNIGVVCSPPVGEAIVPPESSDLTTALVAGLPAYSLADHGIVDVVNDIPIRRL